MSTAIVGVDPSSRKLAITVTEDEAGLTMDTTLLPEDIALACRHAAVWIQGVVDDLQATDVHVFIEEPVVGRGGVYATLRQAKVHGALLCGVLDAGGVPHPVNNQRAKKEVVGKGNVDKRAVAYWCKKTWPTAYRMAQDDQDLIDSAMMNRYGAYVLELRKKVIRHRQGGLVT